MNQHGEVVGFFVLHQFYQHEGYDTPENVVYVRSLSVNEKFQGHGYGTKMMMFYHSMCKNCSQILIICILS